MSLPYMPFFVDDYEANTAHLTLQEDGVYNRLLRLCWRTPGCSIPHDDEWIRRMMRVDQTDYASAVLPIIREFFKVDKGRLYSPRLMSEYLIAKNKHEKRVKAGKKGGRPSKPLKNNETDENNALAKGKQTESNHNHNHNHKDKKVIDKSITQKNRGCRLPDDWFPKPEDEFLKPFNLTAISFKTTSNLFEITGWPSLARMASNRIGRPHGETGYETPGRIIQSLTANQQGQKSSKHFTKQQ